MSRRIKTNHASSAEGKASAYGDPAKGEHAKDIKKVAGPHDYQPSACYPPSNNPMQYLTLYHSFSAVLGSQPSIVPIVEQQYISHFMSSFAKQEKDQLLPNSWMSELPHLVCTNCAPSLLYAIRAASMASFGNAYHEMTIQIESCRLYTVGLRYQHHRLHRLMQQSGPKDGPTVEEVFTSVMFTFFELTSCTGKGTWSGHIFGAMKLCELMGPEAFRTGLGHQLFRTLRYISVSIFADTH
jgi:hypothetical protein